MKPVVPQWRPFTTLYFLGDDLISHGSCKVAVNAARNACGRIFDGQYDRCEIVDRADGTVAYTVIQVDGMPRMYLGRRK